MNYCFKYIIAVLAIIAIIIAGVQDVNAQEAGASATIASELQVEQQGPIVDTTSLVVQKLAIKRVLERYNSPMVDSVDSLMDVCIKHEIDCYLLPSIAGVESGFGKALMPDSYNPFGWGGGMIYFDSWEEGYRAVGSGLKTGYIDKGAETIEEIGPIYAANPKWAEKVRFFMAEFEREEEQVARTLQ